MENEKVGDSILYPVGGGKLSPQVEMTRSNASLHNYEVGQYQG